MPLCAFGSNDRKLGTGVAKWQCFGRVTGLWTNLPLLQFQILVVLAGPSDPGRSSRQPPDLRLGAPQDIAADLLQTLAVSIPSVTEIS